MLTAITEKSGVYLEDCQIKPAMPFATDVAIAKRLWKVGEELVGQSFDI
jgi:hypothetical protein